MKIKYIFETLLLMRKINEREKVLQKEIEKIDQKAAVIVPILLVLNKKDHFYCVENKIDSLKVFEGLSYQDKKVKINSCLENYQTIQEHLLKKASLCTVVPISINNLEETLVSKFDFALVYYCLGNFTRYYYREDRSRLSKLGKLIFY